MAPNQDDTTAAVASEPEAEHAESAAPGHSHHGYISGKDRYLARLKRIEGQARGIGRMVDEEKYCIDILTQISAVTKALESVALGLLDDHLRHCVMDAAVEAVRPPTPSSRRPRTPSPAW